MKKLYSFSLALLTTTLILTSANAQLNRFNAGKSSVSQGGTKPLWSAGEESMPENLKAFEENKGQYPEIEGNKVLFGCNYQGMNLRLDKKGIIYSVPHLQKLTEEEIKENKEKAGKNEAQEEKEKNVKVVYHNISLEFVNANPNANAAGEDKFPSTFGGLDATNPHNDIGDISGYSTVTYHNMYPGIDVVFSFQPKQGIKYSINVKPGADASVIKMRYHGQDKLSIDDKGNLCIGVGKKTITDHAPVTTENGKQVSSSFYLISKDEVGFKVERTDPNSEILIDPAVTWNTAIPGTYPLDCCMDAANNTYVLVCTGNMNAATVQMAIQKYSPGGALVWNYNLTQFPATWSASDLTCDPAGNTYVASPYAYANFNGQQYALISLTSGMALRYFYNTYNLTSVYETWNLSYSCDYSKLIQGGAPQVFEGQTGIINPANGTMGPVTITATHGEIYGGTIAPNGFYYCLASNPQFEPGNPATNELICYNITGAATALVWQINAAYGFDDYEAKTPVGMPLNALAAGCSALYTYDGVTLEERNLGTGAIMSSLNVPGGSNTSSSCVSGVAVDPACGFVYAGSTNAVYVYTSALGAVTNYGVPGLVYDVCFNNSRVSTCGTNAGNGFVAQFPAQTCVLDNKTHTDATCAPTGTASVSPLFCAGPYTYTWSNGATTSAISGLSAGTYTVNIGTPTSCVTESDTVLIKASAVFTLSETETNVKCFGGSTGSANVNVVGGTAPYTYLWSPVGGTNATATGLSAGTYTISVTDASPCTVTASVTITQPPLLTVTTSTTPANCTAPTGTATATPGGGTPAYTYLWAPSGSTNATATGLSAGTYTITVTDANGCTATATAIVVTTGGMTANITALTNVSCFNGNNGSISSAPGGGTAPYTYNWTPSGGTNATATGLTAGSYTVTITDANGCVATASATITQPPLLTIATGPIVNVLCNGGNNGSIGSAAGGGTPAYTYNWTPSGGTNATATGLTAGSYTITVTDAHGCTATATATVTQPPLLTVTTSTTPATCGAPTGTATANAGGGTGAYTYNWTPSGGTNATATGLSAGTYTITVKDANGCTATATAIVVTTGGMTANITAVTNVSCFNGNNGSITSATAGGTAPYTYSWAPTGGTNATATGLSAATYTVTITDANGCTATASATVTQPPLLTITTGPIVNVLCNGGNNGSIGSTAGGGTPAYTYNWSNGQTNANATGLTAGSYTITVTDANGCTATASATVTEPPLLTVNTGPTVNVLCNGGTNGSIGSTTGGGTGAYTYNWSNAETSATATGLSAGSYTITVTDANGCTATANATVTEPAALTQATSFVGATCGQSNGSATVTPGGGTPAYTYSWSNAQTNATATGLSAATYTVTVTDANGCTITASVTVPNAPAETVTITSITNVLCNGGTNGAINTNTVGGTVPYTYTWSNGQTNANATGLSAGTYTLTVQDNNNCTATVSATVTEPPVLTVTAGPVTNITCNGANNGSIGSGPSGGTPAYTYNWSNGDINPTATGLSAGTYTITITDANGCTASSSATVTEPPVLTATIGPPTNVSCNGGSDGSATVTAGGGTPNYTYNWTTNGNTNAANTGLSAGTYNVTVTDNNGCTATATVTITEPTPVSLTMASNTAFCNQPDGSANVTAAGGTPGYTYSWNNGNTTSAINNVGPGTYNVRVTDANGCSTTATVTVANTPGETVNITATVNASCNGSSDGSLTSNVAGGVAPYTYSWSNAQTSANATGLSAGSYTLTVTDSHGCQAIVIGNVGQPAPLTVTAASAQTICIGQSATISANSGGGTPAYTYAWAPGGGTSQTITVSPVTTTTYTVTITDANNCGPVTATVTITVNPPLSVVMGPPQFICPGGTATITATAGGGDGSYNYLWAPGGGTGSSIVVSPATTTTYTVTVTDNCGTPAVTDSVKVTVNPVPVVKFKADTLDGCSPLCISFTDLSTISSGTITNWAWNFGNGNTSNSQNPTSCYPNPGVYTVSLEVTSNNGCKAYDTVKNMITVYSHPVAAFTMSPQPTTIQDPLINFTDMSTDNYGIVAWQWNFGDNTDNTSTQQNPSHTYGDTGTYCANLKVTNKYGCTDSITNCLVIEPGFSIYIPDAFSPNGDGVNDVFTAKGTFVYNYHMWIFDRWGMQLYYCEDINKGWPGTVESSGSNQVCQEDTYVYLIICYDRQNNKHQFIGKVTLIK